MYIVIILVSTNLLWKVQISLRKKFALAGICSLTALIICVSITRIIVLFDGPFLDIIKEILWANLELSIGNLAVAYKSRRTANEFSTYSDHSRLSGCLPNPLYDLGDKKPH